MKQWKLKIKSTSVYLSKQTIYGRSGQFNDIRGSSIGCWQLWMHSTEHGRNENSTASCIECYSATDHNPWATRHWSGRGRGSRPSLWCKFHLNNVIGFDLAQQNLLQFCTAHKTDGTFVKCEQKVFTMAFTQWSPSSHGHFVVRNFKNKCLLQSWHLNVLGCVCYMMGMVYINMWTFLQITIAIVSCFVARLPETSIRSFRSHSTSLPCVMPEFNLSAACLPSLFHSIKINILWL